MSLFKYKNKRKDKKGITTPYSEFPYVNGTLFDTKEHSITIPKFSPTARHILILCADLDWSGVNPDIFGTMFQGIVDATRRDENGMDYACFSFADSLLKEQGLKLVVVFVPERFQLEV